MDDRLLLRVSRLLFGIFGKIPHGPEAEPDVRGGGSGIFIAPYLGLTARHVSRDLSRLDSRGDRKPPGTFEGKYDVDLFQLVDPVGRPVLRGWQVDHYWDSLVTDITMIQFSQNREASAGALEELPFGYLEWALSPPPVGTEVTCFGFPGTEPKGLRGAIDIEVKMEIRTARVVEVHQDQRDSGMLCFPCFELDQPVEPAFSGGPVLWGDRLCGLVASDAILSGGSYVTTLWPSLLMEIAHFGREEKTPLGDLFERGVLRSADWAELRGRILKEDDGLGRVSARLRERCGS